MFMYANAFLRNRSMLKEGPKQTLFVPILGPFDENCTVQVKSTDVVRCPH